MIIVKLGGSLLQSGGLPGSLACLQQLAQGRVVVIVPGGGMFAEQVRLAQQQFQFDDGTAHDMALLAMQQMALMMASLLGHANLAHTVAEINPQHSLSGLWVWSPSLAELALAAIPTTWEISSDSLAAWLALRVNAKELVLVKSAPIDPRLSLQQLARQQIIDAAFCTMVAGAAVKIRIIHHQDLPLCLGWQEVMQPSS